MEDGDISGRYELIENKGACSVMFGKRIEGINVHEYYN
jgi:hypothetical protein